MKNVLKLAAIASLLTVSAQAASLRVCSFARVEGQVLPIPRVNDLGYYISTTGGVLVTQTIPTAQLNGLPVAMWACQTADSSFRVCYASNNTDDCGSAPPLNNTSNTSWIANPVCRRVGTISGTTLNDQANIVKFYSVNPNQIQGTYCREQ